LPPIINAQNISKAFGAKPLFEHVSFTVSETDRIGLIGPNGSGKSTLLRILAATETPDAGNLPVRKRLRLSYVEQDSKFIAGASVRSVIEKALEGSATAAAARGTHFAEILGRAGFEDLEVEAAALSGGWQKRLAVVESLVQAPDVLLLDEPTNHLDLAGIEWLEDLLEKAAFACLLVSHDRYFLENVATYMAELNRAYAGGLLRVHGNYSAFLEKKVGIPPCPIEAAGGPGELGSLGVRVAAARSESTYTKVQGAHRQGRRTDGRTCRLECENPECQRQIDFSASDRKN
jgi:ABC transport system ATP-binding/permease protein